MSDHEQTLGRGATLARFVQALADHLGAADFAELVTDPEWREILATREDDDGQGQKLGPWFTNPDVDYALDLALAVEGLIYPLRLARPEVAELLDGACEFAYQAGRRVALAEVAGGDLSLSELAAQGRQYGEARSRGGHAAAMANRVLRAHLRQHVVMLATLAMVDLKARFSTPSLRDLAALTFAQWQDLPNPEDWPEMSEKEQDRWVSFNHPTTSRIRNLLIEAIQAPGGDVLPFAGLR